MKTHFRIDQRIRFYEKKRNTKEEQKKMSSEQNEIDEVIQNYYNEVMKSRGEPYFQIINLKKLVYALKGERNLLFWFYFYFRKGKGELSFHLLVSLHGNGIVKDLFVWIGTLSLVFLISKRSVQSTLLNKKTNVKTFLEKVYKSPDSAESGLSGRQGTIPLYFYESEALPHLCFTTLIPAPPPSSLRRQGS
ncbi:hypothetical protein KAI58_03445 [Candidatus Gracilibacteria bacterium]|nr:hypothetical protein [Candidatus Gracilibacteria bacterium]